MRRLRRASSALAGWLADRGVPRALRRTVYGGYCRTTGADPREAELELESYPSLGAFFVRRLRAGTRPLDPEPRALLAPCDGRIQWAGTVERGLLLQAKGSTYSLGELLGSAEDAEALEGALCVTIYLAPCDYHRVHAPCDARLASVRWMTGERRSVAPAVLARIPRVFATNERVALALDGPSGRAFLVMVGALNVGRIRVVGVEPGTSPAQPLELARGAELARFEMGSTVVLVVPGVEMPALEPDAPVRLGTALARFR
jgi:phosphatidylserine decarboxylase